VRVAHLNTHTLRGSGWGLAIVVLLCAGAASLGGCGGQGARSADDVDDTMSEADIPPTPTAEPPPPKAPRNKMNAAAQSAYAAGMQAFAANDLAAAERRFREALAADPKAYQAHYGLAATLERTPSPGSAIQSYENALSLVPDYELAIMGLTQLYIRLGRVADAERFLNSQRTRAPRSAAVLAALGEVKSVQKDSAAAQDFAQQALKIEPDYRPAMVVLARDHYRTRRLDLALYTLKAILDGYGPENPPRDKDNAEARLLRALIYKEQGDRRGAMEELRRVVKLRPDIVEARLNLAAFVLEAGNAAEAAPLLEGALTYDPMNPLLHLNLGDAYRLQGRPKEALKQLDWVTKAAPKMAEPHYNMALVYLFSKIDGLPPEQAINSAISELETYQKMKPRSQPGAGDDAEELLQRARHKKTIMEAMKDEATSEEFE
jgi:Tfp pilus assembly protein PilF